MPLRLTTPTRPGLEDLVGMIPTVAVPGLMMPGQFGPDERRVAALQVGVDAEHVVGRDPLRDADDQVHRLSSASRIASAAKRGGTKTIAVFAPVASTASSTVLNTGMPSTSWPALPGVTPATTWVP